jgi:DNA modification methylase
MEIINVPISDIQAYENNPRKNDKAVDIVALVCDFLSIIPLADFNTVYVFTSGKSIAEMILAFKDSECYYSQDLKWIKNNHVLGRLDYNTKSENIIYGWKGKHEFYGGFQTDVLFFDKPNNSDLHPTMKPIELLKTLLTHGSRENENVYDGFGGSGSTLIACEQTKRKCFMMELDPKYCSVIIERWENLTKQKAVKL